MKTFSALAILLYLAFMPHSVDAQSLAKAKSIRCTFSLMSSSSLREEPPKAEIKSSTLVLQFEDVNALRDEIERLQGTPSPEIRRRQMSLIQAPDED